MEKSVKLKKLQNPVFAVITFRNGLKSKGYHEGSKVLTPIVENWEISNTILEWASVFDRSRMMSFSSVVYVATNREWYKMKRLCQKHNDDWTNFSEPAKPYYSDRPISL